MADSRSGIFTYKEFMYRRNVLKLAPDGFVTIDGALGPKFVSALDLSSEKVTDLRGGVTSITVNAAISPPGATRATIEVIAPNYKGLHEDYYLTLPNGTRTSVFRPMMEVKVYMKGRFLEQVNNYTPRYYCVFWGMITGVQENYSNGVYTFSLNCEDFLVWWKYQMIDMRPDNTKYFFGGAVPNRFPSVFTNMNPWDIITVMFFDSFFLQADEEGHLRNFNFIYPTFSGSGFPPENIDSIRRTYGPMASNVINYWNNRFGSPISSDESDKVGTGSQIQLELFGLKGPISVDSARDRVIQFLNTPESELSKINRDMAQTDIDYTLLGNVQPFGSFDTYGDGAESQMKSKLEIATMVCEMVNMEFFVDTNGHIVFKPPFYNLDVMSGDIPHYKIGPDEIINFNASVDSNSILTYLTVTGPLFQGTPEIEPIGFHADFELMKRYGIRSDKITVMYGMNGKQLRMIAAAEMARRNGQAFTAGVSIPLRPEMRLGYPVYIEHIDTCYYVTGITHSIVFGSTATTDLSLQFKRERVFEDGSSPSPAYLGFLHGDVLKGCVMRSTLAEEELNEKAGAASLSELSRFKSIYEKYRKSGKNALTLEEQEAIQVNQVTPLSNESIEEIINKMEKDVAMESTEIQSGPSQLGYWRIDKARSVSMKDSMQNPGTTDATPNNELVIMTDSTIPFTDKLGYRHIGALPYGANLAIVEGRGLLNTMDITKVRDAAAMLQLSVNVGEETPITGSAPAGGAEVSGDNNSSNVNLSGAFVGPPLPPEIQQATENSFSILSQGYGKPSNVLQPVDYSIVTQLSDNLATGKKGTVISFGDSNGKLPVGTNTVLKITND